MPDMLRFFGFPPETRQDAVRFHFGKSLSYRDRINLMLLLVLIGFVLQIWLLMAWPGVPFMVAAAALGLVKGYDSRIRTKAFVPDMEWSETTLEKLAEIEELRKRSAKWDRNAVDITNAWGCFLFIVVMGIGLFGALLVSAIANDVSVLTILMTDLIIFVVPFWFSGFRLTLKQHVLEIKGKLVRDLAAYYETIRGEREEFRVSMRLARDKGSETMPVDVRFGIVTNPPKPGLYGLQAQININMVQGNKYPYFYCVLVGKKGFGMQRYIDKIELPKKVILEYSEDAEAEVLVIRQETTKTSGYHTDLKACQRILQASVQGLRVVAAG